MGNNWISPLRRGIRNRDVKSVKQILEDAGNRAPDLINDDYTADCFCTCIERNYQSPLHSACYCYDFSDKEAQEILRLLVKHGADVNAPGLWGQTPLHVAARQDCLPLAKLFYENGADMYCNQTDSHQFYPVHCAALSPIAASMRKADVLKYFLEFVGRPEDIQLEDGDGNSPLHVACIWGNPATTAYLIEMGADVRARNNDGLTPREVAKPEIIRVIDRALSQR